MKDKIKELEQRLIKVSEKFNKLPLSERSRINYENLSSTVKYIIHKKSKGNAEEIFNEYCLLRSNTKYLKELDLIGVINGFWTFVQLDTAVINPEAYNLGNLFKRQRSYVSTFKEVFFTTIVNYGFYLNLNDLKLDSFSVDDFEKSLESFEVQINEEITTEGRVS